MVTTTASVEKPRTGLPALPLIAIAVTLLLWASAFVGIRYLAGAFSPGALSLGRLVIGSVALGVPLIARRAWRRPTGRQWVSLVLIGVLWFGVYNVALNAGERRLDAGTSAMLIQLSPILIAVLALFVLRELPSRYLVIGMALAFAGVIVIALSTSGSGKHDIIGVGLCLLSAVSYSISLILQKPLMTTLSAIQVTWVACTVGGIVCLPFAGQLADQLGSASTADVAWLIYLGIFPTAIAFTTYAFALRHMNASSLGVTTYLVPPITVLMSWWILGETPPAAAYVGGALALIGVSIARRVPKRSAES